MKATKAIKKKIKALLGGLPPLPGPTMDITSRGAQMLKDGAKNEDKSGHPLAPSQFYSVNVTLPVNHQRKMIVAYEDAGWQGVLNYYNKATRLFKQLQQKANASAAAAGHTEPVEVPAVTPSVPKVPQP